MKAAADVHAKILFILCRKEICPINASRKLVFHFLTADTQCLSG